MSSVPCNIRCRCNSNRNENVGKTKVSLCWIIRVVVAAAAIVAVVIIALLTSSFFARIARLIDVIRHYITRESRPDYREDTEVLLCVPQDAPVLNLSYTQVGWLEPQFINRTSLLGRDLHKNQLAQVTDHF